MWWYKCWKRGPFILEHLINLTLSLCDIWVCELVKFMSYTLTKSIWGKNQATGGMFSFLFCILTSQMNWLFPFEFLADLVNFQYTYIVMQMKKHISKPRVHSFRFKCTPECFKSRLKKKKVISEFSDCGWHNNPPVQPWGVNKESSNWHSSYCLVVVFIKALP